MVPGLGFDQLCSDADATAGFAYAAFEHIAHAELASDLLHVDRATLVGEGAVAGDDEKPPHLRQRGDDLLDLINKFKWMLGYLTISPLISPQTGDRHQAASQGEWLAARDANRSYSGRGRFAAEDIGQLADQNRSSAPDRA